jgi:hypothetical protein
MYQQKTYYGNKYGAKRQTYDGYNYDSKLEASRAWELDMELQAGNIKAWERQFKVDLYFYNKDGDKILYKPWKVDFRVEQLDGTFVLEEVKGMETEDFRVKRDICSKVWIPDHPDHTLVILKQAHISKRF